MTQYWCSTTCGHVCGNAYMFRSASSRPKGPVSWLCLRDEMIYEMAEQPRRRPPEDKSTDMDLWQNNLDLDSQT